MGTETQQIKVGDELAFYLDSAWSGWEIYNVDRITPSGRIVCGPYILNSDLTVRGPGHRGPWNGELVTQEIRDSIYEQKLRWKVRNLIRGIAVDRCTIGELEDLAELLGRIQQRSNDSL